MAPLPDYVSGTITLTNGSAAFTGSGTGWLAAAFREGDTILGIEDNPGVVYVIESITDNDAGTLTQPWDGPTGTYTYRMRYLPDGQRVTAQARQLIELLGNGNLQALAGLSGTPNTLAMFTGTGAMVEVPRTDLVSGVAYDVQVDTLADRDAYDTQPEGFAVLVADIGDGRAAIYSRVGGSGWSDPAYVTGPSITLDVGSVTATPFGSDPDVTLTSVPGGYELDFDLPENATFQSGTITTLDPGEDATFDLVPVAGGYQLDLGVPRGPTGDIDGVTSFWQSRITVDTTAAAARAGLETGNRATHYGLKEVFTGLGDDDEGMEIALNHNVVGNRQLTFGATDSDVIFRILDNGTTAYIDALQKSLGGIPVPITIYGRVSAAPTTPFGLANKQYVDDAADSVAEYGSNANGRYIRYANGWQETVVVKDVTVPISDEFTTSLFATIVDVLGGYPLPAAFIEEPAHSVFSVLGDVDVWNRVYLVTPSLTTHTPYIYLVSNANRASATYRLTFLSKGRWK